MLSSIKFAHTKKPRPGSTATKYANFDLEDREGTIRCILWPEDFVRLGDLGPAGGGVARPRHDRPPRRRRSQLDRQRPGPAGPTGSRYTTGLIICLDEAHGDAGTLKKVHEIVRGYPGKIELHFQLSLGDAGAVRLKSRRLRVDITPELRRRVDELLGPNHVRLITTKPAPAAPKSRNGNRRPGGRGIDGGLRPRLMACPSRRRRAIRAIRFSLGKRQTVVRIQCLRDR